MGNDRRGRVRTGSLGVIGGLLAGLLFVGCGGGGSPHASAPPPLAVTTAGSISIPVPSVTAQGYGYLPYSATTTITVTRAASVTGPVTLAVSGLPTNVVANFSQASLASTDTTSELSIQAGYPSTVNDPTLSNLLFPVQGTSKLTITATGTGVSAQGTLTLDLVNETPAYALSFLTPDDQYLQETTVLNLSGSTPLTQAIAAYDVTGNSENPGTGVILGVTGAPLGLEVAYDATSVNINDNHTVTFTAQPSLAAGVYAFNLTATYQGSTQVLPVVIDYGPSPFFVRGVDPSAQVPAGGSVTFPIYLGRNDAFFSSTATNAAGDPTYLGGTQLSASTLTPGLTATLGNADPANLAEVSLTLAASSGVAPGTYPVALAATRQESAASPVATTFNLPVTVLAQGSPATWIQAVEWGQTVLAPGLPLIAGKPALLCVQLLAGTPGVTSPSVTATLGDSTVLTLQGPASVPTAVAEGDLADCYTVLLPGAKMTGNLQVALKVGGNLVQSLKPTVVPATSLNLTLVPIIHEGITPDLPADQDTINGLLDFWPLQTVNIKHRAPYTTSTQVATPPGSGSSATDYSMYGWYQLLDELSSLRMVDGSQDYYYGLFDPNFPASFQGSSIVGLSLLGEGIGMGVDETVGAEFENDDGTRDNCVMIMVHEEGHAFNLNHAPANGAAAPQLNYPYAGATSAFVGAGIGTWGYNANGDGFETTVDPGVDYDVMSYATNPHWVSDWNYLAALGWIAGTQATATAVFSPAAERPVADQWVVSGGIDPAGQVHLAPLVRITGEAKLPKAGGYRLAIEGSLGTRSVRFGASQVPDLPEGFRHFAFTVPAAGTVNAVEVQSAAGTRLLRRAGTLSLAQRARSLAADAGTGALVAQESAGKLHLQWDATAHPYVNVIHEGTRRTTLGLHLTGGQADLSLAGLEPGGRFQIHYSDGLNPVVRYLER